MKYQWICGNYNHFDKTITGYVRGQDKKKYAKKITGFIPYGLVHEDEYVVEGDYIVKVEEGHKGLSQDLTEIVNLKKVYTTDPMAVRKKLRKDYKETWESNVKFVRRLLIDTKVKAGFNAPNRYEINYTEMQPSNFTLDPVISVFDIEVNSDDRSPDPKNPAFEITCATVWDNKNKRYLTVMYWPDRQDKYWIDDNWLVIVVPNEIDLLTLLVKYFKRLWPDLITGWYITFDIEYFKARCDELGVKHNFYGMVIFDLIKPYRMIRGGSYGNRLKDVVVEEGFVKAEDLVAAEFRSELWTNPNNHDDFLEYNRNDVKYCIMLIRKYNIVTFFWRLKNFCGTEDINVTAYTQMDDTYLLRLSKIYLPTGGEVTRPKFRGAIVIPTVVGVHSGAAIYDFSTMYANEIIAKQYSPELMHLPLKERLKRKPGIIPKLCMIFLDQRHQYDKLLDLTFDKYGAEHPRTKTAELLRNVSKFLLLSVWGFLAARHCRIHDYKLMEQMVKDCREWLLYVRDCAEKRGYKTLAGDTDSIIVLVPFERRHELEKLLQNDIQKRARVLELERPPVIKIDAYAKKIIFVRAKQKKRGAMKRYAMLVIEKKNKSCNFVDIKGFDTIRGDQSKVTKDIQKKCIESIFNDKLDEFAKEVQQTIKDIQDNKIPLNDIAINMNLRQKLDDYKSNTEYVRGAKYAKNYLGIKIRDYDRIKMIFVKNVIGYPNTNVVCYLDVDKLPKMSINTDKIINKTIKKKIETILEVTDWTWDRVTGKKNLAEAFV